MSRLTELIAYVKNKDPQIGIELENEFKEHSSRLAFGLNFERHRPEVVELPRRVIRKGDKVRKLSPRGEKVKNDPRIWIVKKITEVKKKKIAVIEIIENQKTISEEIAIDDLVVIAEFRDYLYPGLISTGKVERGRDKPYHTVINGENYHVLRALTYTHRGKIDAIYIDPPYNTGAKDWKYNNDYVEKEDLYRHSKWLAFMERRLIIAKELMNPISSVLIVTIDEKEFLRLGLLLEQIFPEARIQMVTSVISSQGSTREGMFSRAEEYLFFVFIGNSKITKVADDMLNETGTYSEKSQLWFQFIRGGKAGKGTKREDSKNLFYPLFVDPKKGSIVKVGDPIPLDVDRSTVSIPKGTVAVWPLFNNGGEGRWRTGVEIARRWHERGLLRVGKSQKTESGFSAMSIRSGTEDRINKGEILIIGHDESGGAILEEISGMNIRAPKSVWNRVSHNAGWHGTKILTELLPGRSFPFPKSLYAVEDALRFIVAEKSDAIILDFFSGSGTTAHAVMRLNKQDNGKRQSICITNNEVGADEQKSLRDQKLRPGDEDWEKWGICNFITKPRVEACITGRTSTGDKINGEYKYNDIFPMADGLEENAEFFDLTYETSISVSYNLAFSRIAPLLWMRAGSQGKRINSLPKSGFEVVDTYGLLVDLDKATDFCKQIKKSESVKIAYIVTNDDRRFQLIVKRLPEAVEPVRLYESYLKNFEITGGE